MNACLALSPHLERAYRATAYCVFFPTVEQALRVGECPRWLTLWLKERRIMEWALITACNPHSRFKSRIENCRAQNRLRETLRQMGYRFLPAENRAAPCRNKGRGIVPWPPEPAFFIPGLPVAKARLLACRFAQNAFLFGRQGRAVCLRDTLVSIPYRNQKMTGRARFSSFDGGNAELGRKAAQKSGWVSIYAPPMRSMQ